jgi:spore coat protein U-like protein
MTPRPILTAVAALVLPIALSAGSAPAAQYPRGLLGQGRARGCTIETRALAFGMYDPLAGTSVDALGQVIYTCEGKQKNIRIEMSRGSANSYDRRMSSADDYLTYNVYLDAGHTTVWGDGSSGTDFYFDEKPPDKTSVTVPAYGRIFSMQDVRDGQYLDLLQVTVQF